MIDSIGVDIVDINRIRKAYERFGDRFLDRLFSKEEIEVIKSRKAGLVSTMAGKFAAKEAVLKALGHFFEVGVAFHDVEVLNKPSGAPFVRLPRHLTEKLANKKILISISHEKQVAMATALIADEV